MKKKMDAMLIVTFLTQLFYSATYPYIYKMVVVDASSNLIAAIQIINCLSVVIIGRLWNKRSDSLFKYYPLICAIETIVSIAMAVAVTITNSTVLYFICNNLIVAFVTRHIMCGGIKLKAIRYRSEKEREAFDNNNNSADAIATIIGSLIAMVVCLDFVPLLWIATIGGAIDNTSYIFIYRSTIKRRKEEVRQQK